MDYSIIIPVFNKAPLTRHCLNTLRATLAGAGEGEVIVVDNASSDETPRVLEEFPWARVLRNERNLGFAAANNQAARTARGRFLVLLNNDTEAKAGWLATMLQAAQQDGVGVVGARLLYPNGTLQHGGVVFAPLPLGRAGFYATHDLPGAPGDHPYARERRDLQAVTAACCVTPRELFLDLGGLDEGYWNGYEDVDYCLRVRERGLRVVYAGDAVLTHFESQSGTERYRKVSWNVARLADRWNGKVRYDLLEHEIARGTIRRTIRLRRGNAMQEELATPGTAIVVHGGAESAEFTQRLRANRSPVDHIVWARADDAAGAAGREMEIRSDRYVAIVDARCELRPGWLDELIRQIEFSPNTGAAAYVPGGPGGEDRSLFTAGAGCTLVAPARYPQHERLAESDTIDGAVADFLIRGIALRAGVRAANAPLAEVPHPPADAVFERRHGIALPEACDAGRDRIERALSAPLRRPDGLVSIVMLSWNAPEYTKMALESIRAYTKGAYEVVIVDNGSGPETTQWLSSIVDPAVRVVFNAVNRGYAGGNNDGMAAARGDFVVLLNNDVVVTEGWLEGLLEAFERIPRLGISAPRSNIVAGDQVVLDAAYKNLDEMHAYAARRRERYRGRGYMTDRAIGLCLCVDRRVIDEVGGIDERFGVGNFEDDDFCLRVRAAGYRIHVCDDVFIHHFGSKTFAANKVDWQATMQQNWSKFAEKWDLPRERVDGGYQPSPAIRRGFVREKHFVALPASEPALPERRYEAVFAAVVRSDRDWEEVAAFVRRYLRAFGASQPVLLAIGVFDGAAAADVGARASRIAEREGIPDEAAADVLVSDETGMAAWLDGLPAGRLRRVNAGSDERFDALEVVAERSPSALRRLLEGVAP